MTNQLRPNQVLQHIQERFRESLSHPQLKSGKNLGDIYVKTAQIRNGYTRINKPKIPK